MPEQGVSLSYTLLDEVAFFIIVLTSYYQTFLQSLLRLLSHGCINHDIVVGLCSKLLMRLSYCIHRIYKLEFLTLAGFDPGPSQTGVGYSYHSTKVLTLILFQSPRIPSQIGKFGGKTDLAVVLSL